MEANIPAAVRDAHFAETSARPEGCIIADLHRPYGGLADRVSKIGRFPHGVRGVTFLPRGWSPHGGPTTT